MKGVHTNRKCLGRVFALLLITLANAQVLNAADLQIVIVKSGDNRYFNRTTETLIGGIESHAQFKVIDIDDMDVQFETLQNADIVVAFGISSSEIIPSQSLDQLLINAYITLEQTEHLQHRKQRHIAVLLDQSFERYLAFSHQLLNLTTLGTISSTSPTLNSRQQELIEKLILKLDQYQLDGKGDKLLSTVRQLAKKNEALLMRPDQSIYNNDTLKGILLTSYRSRTPVISYSPGHVKSGALAAIYSSPADIGRHLADLINRYLMDTLDTDHMTVYPRYYSIAINQRVAYSLGLELPSKEKLRQFIDEITR